MSGHRLGWKHLKFRLFFSWAFLGGIAASCPCLGQTWTQNFDASGASETPAWIVPLAPEPGTEGSVSVSYQFPPAPGRCGVLISLVFDEKEGGFLRAFWKSSESSAMLCENLYEGIGLPNQRSLFLSQELLEKGGVLTFQSSGNTLGIHRIQWDWLKPTPILAVEDSEPGFLGRRDVVLKEAEVNGEPLIPVAENWEGRIVTAPLMEKPERIEQGTEFSVELVAVPVQTRLECKLSGLELNTPLILWVNGKNAGTVYPEIPDLRDKGYQFDPNLSPTYAGWRKAALNIGQGLLQAGTNKLQFSTAQGQEAQPKPLALKELALQLNYSEVKP